MKGSFLRAFFIFSRIKTIISYFYHKLRIVKQSYNYNATLIKSVKKATF
ncbi:hypothetical protein PUND_a1686 [Pseudoalteromonas undina]|nr:hypothetical protein PUND_a1686 [Pseudoalteromonas undina]